MRQWSFGIVLLLVGVLIGTAISHSFTHGQLDAPKVPPETTSYRALVNGVLPAVVSIEAKRKNVVPQDDSLFRTGFGSGVIVDAKGVILTNYHVVRDAKEVIIEMADGQKLTSTDIKSDPQTDLAIVQVKTDKALPTLELGDSKAMEIGDRVLAVGAPFGLSGSVTAGIISGKGRSLKMNLYEDFLQTDAAVNPGNSGGPLINLEGKVIGINTAIKSQSGGSHGVGLAISSRLIQSIVPQLLKNGIVKRGYIGVQVAEIKDDELAARLGLRKNESGVIATHVFRDGPGYKGGLDPADVLLTIAGKAIDSSKTLQSILADLPQGRPVVITLLRKGKAYSTKVTVDQQPSDYGKKRVTIPVAPKDPPVVHMDKLDADVARMTSTDLARLGYPNNVEGVLVISVKSKSPTNRKLIRGMVITSVDRIKVDSVSALETALQKANPETGILVQVYAPQIGSRFVLVKK